MKPKVARRRSVRRNEVLRTATSGQTTNGPSDINGCDEHVWDILLVSSFASFARLPATPQAAPQSATWIYITKRFLQNSSARNPGTRSLPPTPSWAALRRREREGVNPKRRFC